MSTWTRAALTVLIGLIIWFLPHTEAIKPEGWHLLAIFTATIVGFILRPWPTGYYGTLWYCCCCGNELYYDGASFGWLCRG